MKRIASIQDISCLGKCSLTVALPIISAMGVEACIVPTAVLSTHTGGFNNYTFHPLYDEFRKITRHWESLGMEFDAIYVGYIGNVDLVHAVSDFIDKFAKKDTVVFIDPVMADNGSFYSGLDENYAKELSKLCKKADIITPNMTEAMILSGENPSSYKEPRDIVHLAQSLSSLCENVIITGVHTPQTISTIAYDKASGEIFSADKPLYDGVFYGAGDLFSSAFIGLYINGKSLFEATQIASDFVKDCIIKTMDERDKYWYGLKFEQSLPLLTKTQ